MNLILTIIDVLKQDIIFSSIVIIVVLAWIFLFMSFLYNEYSEYKKNEKELNELKQSWQNTLDNSQISGFHEEDCFPRGEHLMIVSPKRNKVKSITFNMRDTNNFAKRCWQEHSKKKWYNEK